MSDTKTDISNPEVLVREKLDELISFRKDNDSKTDFWAKQFDLGLAWVHFPEGAGGLNVNPKFQLLVNETLRKEGISINNRIANLLGIGMGAPTIVEYGTKDQIDKVTIVNFLCNHPIVIKRPILEHGELLLVGFNETNYQKLFN